VGYSFINRREKGSAFLFILSTASLWVSWDWTYQRTISTFPWLIPFPYAQWNNIALAQWASIGGIWLVSFIVMGFSASIYLGVVRKSEKIIIASTLVLIFAYGTGYFMYASSEREAGPMVRVSLIQENIAARQRWDQSFTDSLGQIFIDLNEQAVKQDPQIIAWTETAIPWTFMTDDALVNKILDITYKTGTSHLIGMLTKADNNGDVYNSIYYIRPDGTVTGRYDKRDLLTFLERPLFSTDMILPFRQSRYDNILPGNRDNIIPTKYGVIGTLICNETLPSTPAMEAVNKGAQVIFVASNDSWFFHSALGETHLASARMRAIETRRDIVFDANRGFAGVIRASGRLEVLPPSVNPRTLSRDVILRDGRTFYSQFPDGVILAAFSILVITILNQKRNETKLRRKKA
jgi:apolipoprotein N-acyltransferase